MGRVNNTPEKRVLTSMGCVKLTAKQAAVPPHAMDSMRFGLRTVDSAIVVVGAGDLIILKYLRL